MTEPDRKPDSPFRLNPARITLLVLIVLAVLMIIGGINGGLEGYQQLREASQDATTQSPPAN